MTEEVKNLNTMVNDMQEAADKFEEERSAKVKALEGKKQAE